MTLVRLLTYVGFALWVGLCAAAPEFIWQGLEALRGHFSLANLYGIFLIGLILTVFVEPLLERARDGRWTPEHRNTRSLLLTAPTALAFGIVAVGMHECMTAFLSASQPQQDGVVRGFWLILIWAYVPLTVTLAWLGGRLPAPLRHLAGIAAAVCVVAGGWLDGWPPRDIIMTSIPCIALIPLGQAYVAGNWNEGTFEALAIGLAAFIGGWLVLTWLLQTLLWPDGVLGFRPFGEGDLGEDIRFYLGWAAGLVLAPNPISGRQRR